MVVSECYDGCDLPPRESEGAISPANQNLRYSGSFTSLIDLLAFTRHSYPP